MSSSDVEIKERQIAEQMTIYGNILDELGRVVGILQDKLTPILYFREGKSEVGQPTSDLCSLALDLESKNSKLNEITGKISDINLAIEL